MADSNDEKPTEKIFIRIEEWPSLKHADDEALGPGCCKFWKKGIEWNLSNVGTAHMCDHVVAQFEGEFMDYTEGKDCK